MGETWKARVEGAAGVSRLVVVKRIVASMATDERFIKAFIDEARITATLAHGNIAQVVEFGEVEGEYFLAIEFVEGKTLELVLAQSSALGRPRLPVEIACQVACELLEALHYAHTRTDEAGRPLGIVHRDISPDNVLLGFDGQVKVVDFGVAKARLEGRPVTEPGTLKGKWNYFSPEQARTEEVDARSDLFAVGIVLYRMLCGRLPFDGQLHQALFQIINGKYPHPREVAPGLPDALVEILLTALHVDRERRFQSAHEMELRLRTFLAQSGLPASAGARREFLRELFAEEPPPPGPADEQAPFRPTVTPAPSAPLAPEPTLVRSSSSAPTVDARPEEATPFAPSPPVRPLPPPRPRGVHPAALLAGGAALVLLGAAAVVAVARPRPPAPAAPAPALGPARGVELRRLEARALSTDEVLGRGPGQALSLDLARHNLAAGLEWAVASTGASPMPRAEHQARGAPLFVFGRSTVAPTSRTGWTLAGGAAGSVVTEGLVQASAFEFRPFERAADAKAWSTELVFAGPPAGRLELPVQVFTEDSAGFVRVRWAQPPARLSFAFGPADSLREAVVACRSAAAPTRVQPLRGMAPVSFDAPAECAVGLVDDPAATGALSLMVNAR